MITIVVSPTEWVVLMLGIHQAMFSAAIVLDDEDLPMESIVQNLELLSSSLDAETIGKTAAELSNRLKLEREAEGHGAVN